MQALIETIRERQIGISMDKIMQLDIEADIETIYTIGIILATIYDYVFKCKKSGKKLIAENLETELTHISNLHKKQHEKSRLKQEYIDKITKLQSSSPNNS